MFIKCDNDSDYYLTLQVFSCLMNPVEYVHPAAFKGLLVLERLRPEHTKLRQLPSLQHIGHSLTTLKVSSSTYFIGNDAQDFIHLMNIKHILLDQNGFRTTPFGLDLIANTIQRLEFASNAINSLTSMGGVKFDKLDKLDLQYNNITHLHPDVLFTPYLQLLYLQGNNLVSLGDVTQYSWGSLLPKHEYLKISLQQNPWHCNGSLTWMFSNLFKSKYNIIYAKPPFKPYIRDVDRMLCKSPDARCGTTIVPMNVIERINISIRSLRDLAGKSICQFASNIRLNFSNLKSFIMPYSTDDCPHRLISMTEKEKQYRRLISCS